MQDGLHIRDLMHHDRRLVQLRCKCPSPDFAVMIATVGSYNFNIFSVDDPSI